MKTLSDLLANEAQVIDWDGIEALAARVDAYVDHYRSHDLSTLYIPPLWAKSADGPSKNLLALARMLKATSPQQRAALAPSKPPAPPETRTVRSRSDKPDKASSSSADVLIGARGGRWKVGAPLGRGGQGRANRVSDETEGKPGEFAAKRLWSKRSTARERFEREVEVIAKLSHPGVVSVVDFSQRPAPGRPFYVMPLYPNGDVDAFCRTWRNDVPAVLRCFDRICSAVGHAHSHKIIHRDLKPWNVLFKDDWSPVVADFGICFDMLDDSDRLTEFKERVGPRFFIAPEAEDGRIDQVTVRSDIYSLGKLLWYMLAPDANNRLFSRERWGDAAHDLVGLRGDRQLRFINERILAKTIVEKPEDRLESVDALSEVVREVLMLVERGFEPLGRDMRCKFCGEGTYIQIPPNQLWYGFGPPPVGGDGSTPWRGLACQKCGKIEIFRSDLGARLDWMTKA